MKKIDDSLPLDHLVVDVDERLEEAAAAYRALGFRLTAPSRHSLGSSNCLAVFPGHYLELLGLPPEAAAARPELAGFPAGLNGLVFRTEDPDALRTRFLAAAIPALEPSSFSRPVRLAEAVREARFRVLRLAPGSGPFGRVYFCRHLTPELVWRPEWLEHPNGAQAVARITAVVGAPAAAAAFFASFLGRERIAERAEEGVRIALDGGALELVSAAALAKRYGEAAAAPAGRAGYMAALVIRTRALAEAAAALRAGGVAARIEPRRILVPASAAWNVTLEFVA